MLRVGPALTPLLALAAVASLPGRAQAIELTDLEVGIPLDGFWLFLEGDHPSFSRPELDDARWQQRRLPGESTPWRSRWAGRGWYRLHFAVDAAAAGRDLRLELGYVREAAEVYVNGSLVGSRGELGARPRSGPRRAPMSVLIPSAVLARGDNVVALRIYDPSWSGGVAGGRLWLGGTQATSSHRLANAATAEAPFLVGAAAAALLALAALAMQRTRLFRRDTLWLAATAMAVGMGFVAGTSLAGSLLPLDLAARAEHVVTLLAVACLGGYVSARLEDSVTRLIAGLRTGMLTLAAVSLVGPDYLLHRLGGPLASGLALVVALYGIQRGLRALRHDEQETLPLVVGLGGLAAGALAEIASTSAHGSPPWTLLGVLGMVLLAVGGTFRQALRDGGRAQGEVDETLGDPTTSVLDAALMPARNPDAFLATVVQDIARLLSVRRCSIILEDLDGALRIHAAVGLPRHTDRLTVSRDASIGGWVHTHGRPLTAGSVPPELKGTMHKGQYATSAFLCYPVRDERRAWGVLSVSDRDDGAAFSPGDALRTEELSHKLGVLLSQLPEAVRSPPPPEEPLLAEPVIQARKEAKAVRRITNSLPLLPLEDDTPGGHDPS